LNAVIELGMVPVGRSRATDQAEEENACNKKRTVPMSFESVVGSSTFQLIT
jgi:hypothetical protein